MAKTAKLTEKQQRFVEEYLIDLNATQAAIRAGYSAKTADQQGSRMLANVKVQQAISVAMAERSKRTGINQDRVVLELARIAFVKMTDLVDSHGRIKDNATDDDLACIESVKYKQSESETGSSVEREVKISPKLKALELLTLNPWNEHHWIKKRFFDNTDDETIAMTTNYKCNEWLDKADLKVFETMKKQNPRRYKVAGLGDWGIVDGLVYENWEEKAFSVDEVKKIAGVKSVFGLDFGYTNDPSALFCGLIDQSSKTIWVFDEMYQPGMSNEAIAEQVQRMGYVKEKITADSAEPKSIDRLRELGLKGIRKARKGKDSINNGIDFIQDYHIIIHPRCVNFITEISNYQWDKDAKTGKKLNRPIDDFNHLMDAMRYAIEQMAKGDAFSFD